MIIVILQQPTTVLKMGILQKHTQNRYQIGLK